MRCPDNEFSEHCTADMPSMDSMYHNVLNLEKKKSTSISGCALDEDTTVLRSTPASVRKEERTDDTIFD